MTDDTLDLIFDLAELAGRPQCLCCVQERTGQAGTRKAPPRDSGDLDPVAVNAARIVAQDGARRCSYVEHGSLTDEGAVTRLRVIAYVASTLVPAVVEDHGGRYALGLWDDGGLPPMDVLHLAVQMAVTRLSAYLAEHDAGDWVDPNAVAGAVVDVHDAALALETWWALTEPSEAANA